jgi:2'-5' RNA ligase
MNAQLNLFGYDDVLTRKPGRFDNTEKRSRERYEYFILIAPDENVKRQIALKKSALNYEIGISESDLWSIAHISLFKFASAMHEQLIVPKIKNALEGLDSFRIDLKNLDIYDHGYKKSIVFKFQDDKPVKQVNEILLGAFNQRVHDIDPHLTIARSVPNYDFDKISNLNNYYFKGGFMCDKITVLRRPWNMKTRYEVFAEVSLGRGANEIQENDVLNVLGYVA